jgi:hypothetical protein
MGQGDFTPMKEFLIKHLIPAMLALIFVTTILPAIESGQRFWGRTVNPIEWYGVGVTTPTVHPGGTLKMVYKARVNRQCPSDVRSFIVAPDGTVPIRMPTVAGGYTKPSEEIVEIPISVAIPKQSDPGRPPLTSGPHKYRSHVTRYCHDYVHEDFAIPDAVFRLEVP